MHAATNKKINTCTYEFTDYALHIKLKKSDPNPKNQFCQLAKSGFSALNQTKPAWIQ